MVTECSTIHLFVFCIVIYSEQANKLYAARVHYALLRHMPEENGRNTIWRSGRNKQHYTKNGQNNERSKLSKLMRLTKI